MKRIIIALLLISALTEYMFCREFAAVRFGDWQARSNNESFHSRILHYKWDPLLTLDYKPCVTTAITMISVGATLTSVSVALITLGCIKAFNWAFLSVGIVSAVLALPAWIILIPMLYVIYQYRKPYLKNPFDIDDYSFSCSFRIEL